MSRKIRIGAQLQPQHADYSHIRDAVMRAEELGVDIVFNWDHFFPLYGEPEGKHFECWTMLGAWAEQTEKVELGALVSGGGYRNPDLLADMARTVDHMSGGRLILGVGSGWFEKDYDEYGYEFGTAGSRLDYFGGEYLPRIKARLAALNPAPLREIPMLIGGGGEKKTLKFVAEFGTIWHTFGDIEVLQRKAGILAEHCARIGRDVAEIERSSELSRSDEQGANAMADDGITLFTVGMGGPDYDFDALQKWLTWRDARNAG
ncbi:LLM class F420-dependent oxidoreductase [Nakamurella antarctica]|uniref:LLM class F420-dependent oxidoreductase n=1 Tax=Nakamurella antarctica TaxID=1902245 RepID=A0A3G8ZJR1_9ACTN|nr:LLM class F420-dependent oxidoreductase [Nakamurella antarctica]AZI57017.1 LLM class F420-dependent oxidoreductase [Nakamurella antarctica]